MFSFIFNQNDFNLFRLVLDPIFPTPDYRKMVSNDVPTELKYSLIFDEDIDKPELAKIFYPSKKQKIHNQVISIIQESSNSPEK